MSSSTKQPPAGVKGQTAEHQLLRYFQDMGYFAVRGVPFEVSGEIVSDIDIWLYSSSARGTNSISIVDVKNKQRPKAFERALWVAGLKMALKIDNAFIATTDARKSTEVLARRLGVRVISGPSLKAIIDTKHENHRLTDEEFLSKISLLDSRTKDKNLQQKLHSAKSSLSEQSVIYSANINLDLVRNSFEGLLIGDSLNYELYLRFIYLFSSYFIISCDRLVNRLGFNSPDQLVEKLTNSFRFGDPDKSDSNYAVSFATSLVRQYEDNGKAIAQRILDRFTDDAQQIKAEIPAEYISKLASRGELLALAKSLEEEAYRGQVLDISSQNIDIKSCLGVILDFHGLDRSKFLGKKTNR